VIDDGNRLKAFVRDVEAPRHTIDFSREKGISALTFRGLQARPAKLGRKIRQPPTLDGTPGRRAECHQGGHQSSALLV